MKEGKRKLCGEKVTAYSRQQGAAMKNHHVTCEEEEEPSATVFGAEAAGADLRAAMNAHGAGLLGALGQQMNAHLNSLAVFEGASSSLQCQCKHMVLEIGKLLEALEHYQNSHAQVAIQAALLRRIVAAFAQHVHNTQAFGVQPP